jgi:hypothetical protein
LPLKKQKEFYYEYMIEKCPPNGLMVDFLQGSKVLGIINPSPEYGWIVHSPSTDDIQSAYHILVASNREVLQKDGADMWDSKKIASPNSINIIYEGQPLLSNTSYYWKVKTWCKVARDAHGPMSWHLLPVLSATNIVQLATHSKKQ